MHDCPALTAPWAALEGVLGRKVRQATPPFHVATAAKRWPEDRDSRAKLVVRLLNEGYRALGETAAEAAAERREGLRRTSGLLTGVYGPGYLEELRQDWPE